MRIAQVHRYAGFVAVYVANGKTTYLTPKEAKALAKALNRAAKDIKDSPSFTDSTFATTEVHIDDNANKRPWA